MIRIFILTIFLIINLKALELSGTIISDNEKVISIDYSVSHFSEALEIPPHCALFYRRTWQWSDGKSAHSSVVVGDEWGAEF